VWIEPRIAKLGLFNVKVSGEVRKGDYLLCCTSPGVLGSIRDATIRDQVMSSHPLLKFIAKRFNDEVSTWTVEDMRLLALWLPTVGVAMEDYYGSGVDRILVDLKPR
jgi:hypothetical protein